MIIPSEAKTLATQSGSLPPRGRDNSYQYNLWYMSLCVGDRFVCRSERNFWTFTRNGHRYSVTHTRCCIDTIDSPDDEHEIARNM